MKKLICLVASFMLIINTYGQKKVDMFTIGRSIPDIPFSRIINYKDTSAYLSSFGKKLIVLDFWGVNCSPCIEAFPKMDSIQRALKDKVQFILVTLNDRAKVEPFLKKWNTTHNTKLSIPIVCGESTLGQIFSHQGIPHMVFIRPDGYLVMQSSEEMLLDYDIIKTIAIKGIEDARGNKIKPANNAILKRLKENKWIDLNFIY